MNLLVEIHEQKTPFKKRALQEGTTEVTLDGQDGRCTGVKVNLNSQGFSRTDDDSRSWQLLGAQESCHQDE